jgi:uncharacterized repeat protein (TIGR02543 family)
MMQVDLELPDVSGWGAVRWIGEDGVVGATLGYGASGAVAGDPLPDGTPTRIPTGGRRYIEWDLNPSKIDGGGIEYIKVTGGSFLFDEDKTLIAYGNIDDPDSTYIKSQFLLNVKDYTVYNFEKANIVATGEKLDKINAGKEKNLRNAMVIEHESNIIIANVMTERLLGHINTLDEAFSWYGIFSLGDPVLNSMFEIKRELEDRYNLTLNSVQTLNPEIVFERNNDKLWHVYIDPDKTFHIKTDTTDIGIEIDFIDGFKLSNIVPWEFNKIKEWYLGSPDANIFFINSNKTNNGIGISINKSTKELTLTSSKLILKSETAEIMNVSSTGATITGGSLIVKNGSTDAFKADSTGATITGGNLIVKNGSTNIFSVNQTSLTLSNTAEINYKGKTLANYIDEKITEKVAEGIRQHINNYHYSYYITVTFNINESKGSAVSPITISRNRNMLYPSYSLPIPNWSGFTFKEWNTEPDGSGTKFENTTILSGNITVFAKWDIYKIEIDMNGSTGTAIESIPISKTNNTLTTTPTTPTWPGHTFKEWNTLADGTGTTFAPTAAIPKTITENITIYAIWVYTVTFNLNGATGTAPTPITIPELNNTLTALPTNPNWAGHTFKEWNTLANGTGTKITTPKAITENITFYAIWT